MAAKLRIIANNPLINQTFKRFLSTSSNVKQNDNWLDKLLVRKIEHTKESHSRLLSERDVVYELQTHNIKPGSMKEYLSNMENFMGAKAEKNMPGELCGSWTVGVGDQDQCVHLWRFEGGYQTMDEYQAILRKNEDVTKLIDEQSFFLRQRTNQFLLPFSFWPKVTPRDGEHIYEIRSYYLKPGTMIEWGNNWAKAIRFRQSNNEAFGGFFSQVGRLYNVHHIWSYKSLSDRKKNREDAWREPGWDQVVTYTVPLIQDYETRIMYPNRLSPTH